MKANTNNIRITPKKINLIADMVRGKDVVSALNLLRFTPKKGAKLLAKLLKSAASNAENNFKQDLETLYIKEIYVGKGVTFKRGVSISRGRVHPRLKRNANVTISIGVQEGKTKTSKKATENEAVAEEGTTATKEKKTTAKKTTTKKPTAKKTVKA
jgi:large subunit ribosomal protein L22